LLAVPGNGVSHTTLSQVIASIEVYEIIVPKPRPFCAVVSPFLTVPTSRLHISFQLRIFACRNIPDYDCGTVDASCLDRNSLDLFKIASTISPTFRASSSILPLASPSPTSLKGPANHNSFNSRVNCRRFSVFWTCRQISLPCSQCIN